MDSDWETFSESSSSEDQEEIDFLYAGQARSILSSLEESIGKIDDFLSFERAFVHGDVVCSLSNPSGQMGRVSGVEMFVDLESVHGKLLKSVNSKRLLKIRSISEGDYVIKGPWLGRVQKVVDKVTVLFDDGTKCEVNALERDKILPLTRNLLEDLQYPYYPGQRVRINSSSSSKSAGWLCGTWRDSQDEGTVCSVEAGLVCVKWLIFVSMSPDFTVNAPPSWQDSKSLTLLSCFSHANWQLGDWCMLAVADQKEQNFGNTSTGGLKKDYIMTRGYKNGNINFNIGELFVIGKISTKVDIVWQDGEHTLGMDPHALLPVNVIDTHEFWPQQFVLEKGASDDHPKPICQRWGVVQYVDAKERTVKVQWNTVPISMLENLAGGRMEETVSAYELIEHPDYSYCFGDIVLKAAQKKLDYQAEKGQAESVTSLNVEAALMDRNHISYQNEFPDDCYLSRIGNVIGFKDGGVEVKWATGLTTKV